jgi:hypothetical protein
LVRESSVDIAAPCEAVFDVVHDYNVRLEWDTLLSHASIVDGSHEAAVGVRTLCIGRGHNVAGFGMETVYISFDRPSAAAVRMTRGPWFIAQFAASIRHIAVGSGSRVIYKFNITGRPKLLGPIVCVIFQRETRKRLEALKRYVEIHSAS